MESAVIEQLPELQPGELKGKTPFYFSFWFSSLRCYRPGSWFWIPSSPARAVAMKPLGDAFIRLITMAWSRRSSSARSSPG